MRDGLILLMVIHLNPFYRRILKQNTESTKQNGAVNVAQEAVGRMKQFAMKTNSDQQQRMNATQVRVVERERVGELITLTLLWEVSRWCHHLGHLMRALSSSSINDQYGISFTHHLFTTFFLLPICPLACLYFTESFKRANKEVEVGHCRTANPGNGHEDKECVCGRLKAVAGGDAQRIGERGERQWRWCWSSHFG